jgi:hypothetical protein
VLYVALAHSRQPDDWLRPSTAEYFPAPQFWQALTAVCAVSGWNVPARHRAHTVDASWFWYVPSEHGDCALCPALATKYP